jgi:eukaryotic-like serine/threonine-protein kinase
MRDLDSEQNSGAELDGRADDHDDSLETRGIGKRATDNREIRWEDVLALLKKTKEARPEGAATGVEGLAPTSESPSSKSTQKTSALDPDQNEQVTIGRYRISRMLGEGGFGRVYLAHDADLDRPVAIKVPIADRLAGLVDIKAYLDEARILARLSHPHIVPVFDVGQTDSGLFYVVSRYMEGGDLASRMTRGRYPFVETTELVLHIGEALQYAHSKDLFHRDIKPANILLDADGVPSVADFGLALRDENVGKGEGLVGTAAYMSPEQARGEGHLVDGRSDIFSLGIVFYELLTGRRPFRGSSRQEVLHKIVNHEPRPLRQMDDRIPKELERICMKALWKRASDRYLSAADLVEDLQHFLKTARTSDHAEPVSPASIDRLDGSSGYPRTVSAPGQSESSVPSIKIVPRGLSSFDEDDADFFLDLLPGPRGRAGMPDGLRFWKMRIEAVDPEKSFRVGIIYGPSGCGKSSLVKAGLLPLLPQHVKSVYLEACRGETETRLLRLIQKAFPGLPTDADLVQSFAALRRGRHDSPGAKTLVVLDQFEQWLFARTDEGNTELIAALRQCDGQRVQVLCLVRDDFWMATTRFMKELEIDLVPDQNLAAVDMFDSKHARKVLTAYGRAYDALPSRDADATREQRAFLDQAIDGLADDGKIVPVRLALFAEMVKGKPWTTATLRDVGGMDGVGVRFLDEAFSSPRSSPKHHYHQKAAQAVLRALLPETSADIKGKMRTVRELRAQSGYFNRPADFDDLIRVLDKELRLITPVDPEGLIDVDPSGGSTGELGYQLTHDYLVQSLRVWLTRKQRETARGRAELLLVERTALWSARPEARYLPSAREWLKIRALTRRKDWTESQRRMMDRASRSHGGRLLGIGAALAAIVTVGTIINIKTRTHDLLASISNANVENIPNILNHLQQYPRWTYAEELRGLAERTGLGSHAQLGYSLALLHEDPRQLDVLKQRLLVADSAEANVLKIGLKPYELHRRALMPWLWSHLKLAAPDDGRILPMASLLAKYDPVDPSWQDIRGKVAGVMVKSKLDEQKSWREALRNVHPLLLEPLTEIYREKSRSENERLIAATVLADYAADRPDFLLELMLDADPKSFSVLFPVARRGPDFIRAVRAIVHASGDHVGDGASGGSGGQLSDRARSQLIERTKETLARRRSRAAVALIQMDHAGEVWPLMVHSDAPRFRGEVVVALRELGADVGLLVDELERNVSLSRNKSPEPAPSVSMNAHLDAPATSLRRSLILALAEYPGESLSGAQRGSLIQTLVDLYHDDPDPGVHSATELVLRRWGELDRTNDRPTPDESDESPSRGWYVNKVGQTMVVIQGPVEFAMGSPPSDPDADTTEELHRRTIPHAFAIAAKEVTNRDFEKYAKENPGVVYKPSPKFSPEPETPHVFVSWFEAASYCNWLSRKEGRPECYLPSQKAGRDNVMRVDVRAVAEGGYRLPAEAEWEYACRAGASTIRYFGSSTEVLGHHEWYLDNSNRKAQRCGSKLPNDFGLFDMLGNVYEWCHDRSQTHPAESKTLSVLWSDQIVADEDRVVRGGSVLQWAERLRSAARNWTAPREGMGDLGFRPARTIPQGRD